MTDYIAECAVSESNQNEQQVICEHIYGFSSAWDVLMYTEEDEILAVRDNQIDDYVYPYLAFIYCPLCGRKLIR